MRELNSKSLRCEARQGREQWERSKAGGANANERHLCDTPVSGYEEVGGWLLVYYVYKLLVYYVIVSRKATAAHFVLLFMFYFTINDYIELLPVPTSFFPELNFVIVLFKSPCMSRQLNPV